MNVYDQEMELYYLRSRYYTPVLCRFMNTDTRIGYLNIRDQNIFAYCSNNCVAYSDDDGEARTNENHKPIPDYPGWGYEIHYDHGKPIGDGEFMPHIHLYSPQKVEYAMNLDGTRHDKNRAKDITSDPNAYKVLEHMKDKKLWPPKNRSGGDDDNTPSQPSSKNKSKTRSNDIYKAAVITSINAYGYATHAQSMSHSPVPVPDRSTPKISLSSIIEAFTPGRSGNLIDSICYAY